MIAAEYVGMSEDTSGAMLRAHALVRCPDCHNWPSVRCSWGHGSPWRLIADGSMDDVEAFLRQVRLAKAERDIDVLLYLPSKAPASPYANWVWIDRGYMVGDRESRDVWVAFVRELLVKHLRLRLYADEQRDKRRAKALAPKG
jgi:hypothetical protein